MKIVETILIILGILAMATATFSKKFTLLWFLAPIIAYVLGFTLCLVELMLKDYIFAVIVLLSSLLWVKTANDNYNEVEKYLN